MTKAEEKAMKQFIHQNMMVRANKYRVTYFSEDSQPALNTVKKWIENGDICGEIIGGQYYVKPNKTVPVNDLVNKVLTI